MFVLIDKISKNSICCSDNEKTIKSIKSDLEYYMLFYKVSEYDQIKDSIIVDLLNRFDNNSCFDLYIDDVMNLDKLKEVCE